MELEEEQNKLKDKGKLKVAKKEEVIEPETATDDLASVNSLGMIQ